MAAGLVGAAVASEVRYVDEFDLSGASCGLGKWTRTRQSVDGHPLTVCGKTFARGFGSHAEGAVGFRTDGKVEAIADPAETAQLGILTPAEKPEPRINGADYGERIDYIYVTPGTRVLDYETVNDCRRGSKKYPSDHFPIAATIVLP